MKPNYYLLVAIIIGFILPVSCKKTQPIDQLSLLPPATTTGANTFGCLVNGTAMLPTNVKPSLSNPNPNGGIEKVFWDSAILEIAIYNANSKEPEPYYLLFHFGTFNTLQSGVTINWEQSSFDDQFSPYYMYHNHLTGSFYDDSSKVYHWYGSYNGSGSILLTNFNTSQKIISGTFSGKMRMQNGNKEVSITNGRFDVKW